MPISNLAQLFIALTRHIGIPVVIGFTLANHLVWGLALLVTWLISLRFEDPLRYLIQYRMAYGAFFAGAVLLIVRIVLFGVQWSVPPDYDGIIFELALAGLCFLAFYCAWRCYYGPQQRRSPAPANKT